MIVKTQRIRLFRALFFFERPIHAFGRRAQPGPLSNGTTVAVQNTAVTAKQPKADVISLPRAASLQDVAAALNAVGATPSDLIAIIEALKQAGAINGTIKVI